MLHLLKPLAIGALILIGAPAIAQETTTDVETAAPATDADPATDLSMGTEVTDVAAVGTPYIRETFGDWALRCLVAEDGKPDPCQLYQLLNDQDGNSVAEISMFPLPSGNPAAAGATIVVPLETLLTEQLQISVDGSATRRYPFTFCNRAGCVARVGFTAEDINQFKRGNAATMRMIPAAAPENQVILNISLSGFTAGYDASGQ
ncbi:MAG: invasion associated locus B family protein [Yoonia sp.]|nr:invasion associated locus B family protein [Yoonia sp.]